MFCEGGGGKSLGKTLNFYAFARLLKKRKLPKSNLKLSEFFGKLAKTKFGFDNRFYRLEWQARMLNSNLVLTFLRSPKRRLKIF